GKDTIVSALKLQPEFHRIISHTTRPPRENFGVMEVNDEAYHFITHDEAGAMVRPHEFVEAKYVHGNVYGTSVAEFQKIADKQQIAMTDIDIQGVKEYLAIKPDTHAIFLLPPSASEWENRLIKRYGILENHREDIIKRLTTARYELNDAMRDERFVVVVNDDLEQTILRVLGVAKGDIDHTSDMAQSISDELLAYIEQKISTLDA
ncbi:hypothetical protein H7Y40_01040, partial [Pedobacter sp.]|nr:hypothetical protein [Candidatus Saccharibacteria bacterium]